MKQVGEAVNIAIQENQVDASDWPLNDLACELAWWVDFFNISFFKDEVVPVPAISFERTKDHKSWALCDWKERFWVEGEYQY